MERLQKQVKNEIIAALTKAGLSDGLDVNQVVIEYPKDGSHGDFSTNVAMQLARSAKRNPRDIAQSIIDNFEFTCIDRAEIAGPGFINVFVKENILNVHVNDILAQGTNYGNSDFGNNNYINVEFVSANPTGDLHLGHARGAALGDSLSNILEAAGHRVTREYYINDAGNQINNLVYSLQARYYQQLGDTDYPMPEDGYHGEDIVNIAKILIERHKTEFDNADEEGKLALFRSYGIKYELEKLKTDLLNYRVEFDQWSSEQSMYDTGKLEASLAELKKRGATYEKDGALWLRSTDFGDDKDRVLLKSDGTYTYMVPDIAYHIEKLSRGDKLIDILGADHHGYIARMQAALAALGYFDVLEVEIIQMVRLMQGGVEVKMSKRTGKAVALRDLVEEVGLDAVRYFFAMRAANSPLDFDMDLAKEHANTNPVYYAHYAHARTCSVLRNAAEKGFAADKITTSDSYTYEEKDRRLVNTLLMFPEVIIQSAIKREPHLITNYINTLASNFHSFYNDHKVINEEDMVTSYHRLALVDSVRITLANALKLVGVSAPEKM
ncbi:arginine--tRNA ligase [Culicoidibacter larvae]